MYKSKLADTSWPLRKKQRPARHTPRWEAGHPRGQSHHAARCSTHRVWHARSVARPLCGMRAGWHARSVACTPTCIPARTHARTRARMHARVWRPTCMHACKRVRARTDAQMRAALQRSAATRGAPWQEASIHLGLQRPLLLLF
eukprot:362534-Chlamydomonas_euryale.AAC.1